MSFYCKVVCSRRTPCGRPTFEQNYCERIIFISYRYAWNIKPRGGVLWYMGRCMRFDLQVSIFEVAGFSGCSLISFSSWSGIWLWRSSDHRSEIYGQSYKTDKWQLTNILVAGSLMMFFIGARELDEGMFFSFLLGANISSQVGL